VQDQPFLAHCTSLIAGGFGDHQSTLRNVCNRARKRLRSQGTKFGREDREVSEGRLDSPGESRITTPSRSDLGESLTRLMVGDAVDKGVDGRAL
jgi:hypothetical protein